jgi:SAM-dependent methyltransferase
MSSYTRQQLESWLKTIDVSDKVIDIGGSQNPIKGRTKSWNVEEYKILDLETPHECKQKPDIIYDLNDNSTTEKTVMVCPICGSQNFATHPFACYENSPACQAFDSISNDSEGIPKIIKENKLDKYEKFDVAFCIEVSEYWWNPIQALKNIATVLKPGGILYISFHFIYPRHYPLGRDYLRYTPEGVEKLLIETGFKIIDHLPRVSNESFYGVDGMRPALEYIHNQVGSLVKAQKL